MHTWGNTIKCAMLNEVNMIGDSPPVGSQQPQKETKDSPVTQGKWVDCIPLMPILWWCHDYMYICFRRARVGVYAFSTAVYKHRQWSSTTLSPYYQCWAAAGLLVHIFPPEVHVNMDTIHSQSIFDCSFQRGLPLAHKVPRWPIMVGVTWVLRAAPPRSHLIIKSVPQSEARV